MQEHERYHCRLYASSFLKLLQQAHLLSLTRQRCATRQRSAAAAAGSVAHAAAAAAATSRCAASTAPRCMCTAVHERAAVSEMTFCVMHLRSSLALRCFRHLIESHAERSIDVSARSLESDQVIRRQVSDPPAALRRRCRPPEGALRGRMPSRCASGACQPPSSACWPPAACCATCPAHHRRCISVRLVIWKFNQSSQNRASITSVCATQGVRSVACDRQY